ncbi:TIGR02221 family CRISPR-associated protein [bacterium]|nr:TIGR02221 family CRISPR-associated protein [bacterium]MBP5434405.1 TIGR02221 family CRISPR-associated protein [bacterium]
MAYTLIASLGTGEGGYRKTNYVIDEKRSFTTSIFFEALLLCSYREVNQVILIGTHTSSWDVLVEGENDYEKKLRDKLLNKNGKLSEELKSGLENYLKERFKIPFIIKVHTDSVDENHIPELFECYSSIYQLINKGNDILFDITHGFRSMPMLVYQALQYHFIDTPERKVELVYGEFKRGATQAPIRNLSEYWRYSQISAALHLFQQKLDGFTLAELIKGEWSAGAKAIETLSDIAQTNFALRFPEVLRQIHNALENTPKNAPEWIEKIKETLKKVENLKDERSIARTLCNYSKYLYDLNLNTQAIITLQNCIETAMAEKFGDETSIGDYDWWKETGKTKFNNTSDKTGTYLTLKDLEYFRNSVAHAGGRNPETKKFPLTSSMPGIYEKGLKSAEKLLDFLEL